MASASCIDPNLASFRRVGLFQAPTLTAAHEYIGVAAILGCLFFVAHMVTVIVTCAANGFGWGVNAWVFDMMGWLAGGLFAFLCLRCSSQHSSISRQSGNVWWILIWAAVTMCVRVLDVFMLFGVVKIDAIYHTPSGATLYANIFSEIVVAVPHTTLALAGSVMLIFFPEDGVMDTAVSDPVALRERDSTDRDRD